MPSHEATQAPEQHNDWNTGYMKLGAGIFRYAMRDDVDPIVAIGKHIKVHPAIGAMVLGRNAEQLHFGLDFIHDTSYQPSEDAERHLAYLTESNQLPSVEGIVLMETVESATATKFLTPKNDRPSQGRQKQLFNPLSLVG